MEKVAGIVVCRPPLRFASGDLFSLVEDPSSFWRDNLLYEELGAHLILFHSVIAKTFRFTQRYGIAQIAIRAKGVNKTPPGVIAEFASLNSITVIE